MEKEKITLEQILAMDLPQIVAYASPVIIFLLLAEWIWGKTRRKNIYEKKDFLAAVAIGAGNLLLGLSLQVFMFSFVLVFYNMVPWYVPHTWWGYMCCFVLVDLCRYWAHRVSHEQRMWWATHVTHHTSEYYNFAISFRTGWTQQLKVIFFIPVPLMGFDPIMFFICHQIAALYQFWIHTEMIRKLPRWIEYIFVTPSHHRVHHGKNAKYIDKNYGSTFIIWDRLFHTFQQEDEKAVYGITKPVNSMNPIYLVFHEWVDIFKDLRRASSLKEAYYFLFGRPGMKIPSKGPRQSSPAKGQSSVMPDHPPR